MARRNQSGGTHAAKPFRNFLYAIYSLINALAFTLFFHHLFLVERSATDLAVMIACGAVAVVGAVIGILKPLFSK